MTVASVAFFPVIVRRYCQLQDTQSVAPAEDLYKRIENDAIGMLGSVSFDAEWDDMDEEEKPDAEADGEDDAEDETE